MSGSTPKVVARLTNITPEAAQKLLRNNVLNRPLDKNRIAKYAKALRENRWKLNGDTIRVDTKNRLLDGQHRLHACVQANIPFPAVLITGLDPSVFDTIDQGKARTGGDIFSICGVTNAALVSSALTVVYQSRHGVSEGATARWNIPDMDEKTALFDSLSDFEARVQEVCHYKKFYQNEVPLALFAGLYYLFAEKNLAAARMFANELAHGVVGIPHPASALKAALAEIRARDYRPHPQARAALIKTAWNAFAAGKDLQTAEIPATLSIPIDPITSTRWTNP